MKARGVPSTKMLTALMRRPFEDVASAPAWTRNLSTLGESNRGLPLASAQEAMLLIKVVQRPLPCRGSYSIEPVVALCQLPPAAAGASQLPRRPTSLREP